MNNKTEPKRFGFCRIIVNRDVDEKQKNDAPKKWSSLEHLIKTNMETIDYD